MRIILHSILCYSFLSCASYEITSASNEFENVRGFINLGQSKSEILALTNPIQEKLSREYSIASDQYIDDDGSTVFVQYMRTSRAADGLTTYDEFTPLVFKDDVLVAIEWASLGGPPTSGQTRDIHKTKVIIKN